MRGIESLVTQAWSPVGSQAVYWGVHPLRLQLGVPRPPIVVFTYLGALDLCAEAAGALIRVRTNLGFQAWAPRPLIGVRTNQASGVCWGCLCGVNSPGAEGVGAQETTAAGKNSLNSP